MSQLKVIASFLFISLFFLTYFFHFDKLNTVLINLIANWLQKNTNSKWTPKVLYWSPGFGQNYYCIQTQILKGF